MSISVRIERLFLSGKRDNLMAHTQFKAALNERQLSPKYGFCPNLLTVYSSLEVEEDIIYNNGMVISFFIAMMIERICGTGYTDVETDHL